MKDTPIEGFISPEAFKTLGDHCKEQERSETERRALKDEILMARLDGRAFHTLTKNMEKPFDARFAYIMVKCAKALVAEFKPNFAYVQSDEISLAWSLKREESEFPFDGKFHKINSVLASFCSVTFDRTGTFINPITFDCRSWAASFHTAINTIIWRQSDAQRNAVNAAAHARFGTSKLNGVNTRDRLRMLKDDGYKFEELSPGNRMGTFVFSRVVEKMLTPAELEAIPVKHRPTGPVLRTEYFEDHTILIDLEGRQEYLFGNKNND
jgi:tRNA(His) 5'-end guanylyltransferase